MRTATHVLVRTRHDLSDDLADLIEHIARREPPALTERPDHADAWLEALGAQSFWAGPAFSFPSTPSPEAKAVAIGPGNANLLQGALADWRPDAGKRWPFLALVEEERAVAVCASVRITPFVHCAGVETLPERRGRGLASRVVAAWAIQVRALGATPFYSTNWSNLASRGVARRLKLDLAAMDFGID